MGDVEGFRHFEKRINNKSGYSHYNGLIIDPAAFSLTDDWAAPGRAGHWTLEFLESPSEEQKSWAVLTCSTLLCSNNRLRYELLHYKSREKKGGRGRWEFQRSWFSNVRIIEVCRETERKRKRTYLRPPKPTSDLGFVAALSSLAIWSVHLIKVNSDKSPFPELLEGRPCTSQLLHLLSWYSSYANSW